jgi:hypothetical protein
MSGAYIVANIPEQILKEALSASGRGCEFVITLVIAIKPENTVENDFSSVNEPDALVDEINALTIDKPISYDEIINAHKRRK